MARNQRQHQGYLALLNLHIRHSLEFSFWLSELLFNLHRMFTHFQRKVESGKNHTRGACISFKCLHKHLQRLAKSNQALTNSVMLLDYTVPHCNCVLCEVSFESTKTNLLNCDIVVLHSFPAF